MSLHRKIDDWFLGYKTRSVRAKDSGIPIPKSKHRTNSRVPLKPGSGLTNLTAAAKNTLKSWLKFPSDLAVTLTVCRAYETIWTIFPAMVKLPSKIIPAKS